MGTTLHTQPRMLATPEIRLLSAADLALLERVDPDVFDNPVQPELAARYLANPGNLLAVALQDGVVVGMGSAIAYVHPDKPLQLFINEVGVSERYRRQGLGKRLMHALLEHGRTMGCTEAWVATEENNAAARALYTAMNGTEDADHAVVYTWQLSSPRGRGEPP
jgi:ribosomal protein S18 acetylase RimI-like enzyme